MMLRSRGDKSGRFHRSPSSRPCRYLASAGATICASSSVSMGGRVSDLGVTVLWSAWAKDEASKESDAMAAVRRFFCASFRQCMAWERRKRCTALALAMETRHGLRTHLPYCSALTCSIHSTFVPPTSSRMAICVIPLVAVAPCQCFTPGGIHMTSPGLISCFARPSCCTQPLPAVTIRV